MGDPGAFFSAEWAGEKGVRVSRREIRAWTEVMR